MIKGPQNTCMLCFLCIYCQKVLNSLYIIDILCQTISHWVGLKLLSTLIVGLFLLPNQLQWKVLLQFASKCNSKLLQFRLRDKIQYNFGARSLRRGRLGSFPIPLDHLGGGVEEEGGGQLKSKHVRLWKKK